MDEVGWSPAVRPGAWAAVDVGLLRHRKLAGLRGRADVLYLACVLHCAEDLTDGRVRAHAARRLLLDARARRSDWGELVAAGLLEPAADGDGWTVPGYLEWNAPRAWRDHQRALAAQRQQRYREAQARRKADGSSTGNASRNGASNALRDGGKRREEIERSSRPLAARACPECGDTMPRGVSMEDHRRLRHNVQPVDVEHGGEAPQSAPSHGVPSQPSRTPEALAALLRDA